MRRLGVVLISCVGFEIFASGIQCLAYPTQMSIGLPQRLELVQRLLLILPAILLLIFGVVLILGRRAISHALFPSGAENLTISAPSLLTAGIAVTGVQLLGRAIPTLVSDLARPYLMPEFYASSRRWLALPVTQLVLGLVLCFNARSITERLLREPESKEASAEASLCPHCGAPYDPRDYDSHYAALCNKCGQPLDLPAE
jgi:hypothetical protein